MLNINPPNSLPPEDEPPRLAIATEQQAKVCVECNGVVALNYVVHLGMVFCPSCARAEEHI